MTTYLVCALVAMVAMPADAQDGVPAFEVASVRRNLTGPPGPGRQPAVQLSTADGVTFTNSTLAMIIGHAYGVRTTMLDRWLIGGPSWVREHRFDVIAKAGTNVTPEESRGMLRRLLEERFGLVIARQKRERPAFALRVNRADGRIGPNLHQAPADCVEDRAAYLVAFTQRLSQVTDVKRLANAGACQTASSIATAFELALDATVIDDTGLTGRWDWTISHASLSRASGIDGDDRPSVTTAAQEQLGLKLERLREPGFFEVLVIESVHPPTEN